MDRALLWASMQRWHAVFVADRVGLIPRRSVPAVPSRELALAISGVRRCGKTTLAVQISAAFPDERVLYYNFEDPMFLGSSDPSGIEILLSLFEQQRGFVPELLILDEVQNVAGWERWVRSAVDQRRLCIIVTGSNAHLLSAELSTSLTGRSMEHTTWPLSVSEVGDFMSRVGNANRSTAGDVSFSRSYALQTLLSWGGLPAVLLMENEIDREKLLRQYLSDIVHRDIINRHAIRNKRALDLILTFYQTNLSSLHSYSSIKKAFGIPVDTIADYTAALGEAFLIFEVERFHQNLKIQTRDPRKVYVVDSGLRRVGARSAEADLGKLLENLVYLELRRRGKSAYYYQEKGEVDFVTTQGYEPESAIQVCAYGMDKEPTRTREVKALVDCLNALELAEGSIVTMDRDEIIESGGKTIRSVSAPNWFS